MDSPTLLCIDLPQVLELRKKTLESHGYSVEIASSMPTAMKVLEESLVAAVLLEYKHHDSEAIACHIKATVSQCADYLAFSVCRDAGRGPVVSG
jgi:CheY-like chemotaxis protein